MESYRTYFTFFWILCSREGNLLFLRFTEDATFSFHFLLLFTIYILNQISFNRHFLEMWGLWIWQVFRNSKCLEAVTKVDSLVDHDCLLDQTYSICILLNSGNWKNLGKSLYQEILNGSFPDSEEHGIIVLIHYPI